MNPAATNSESRMFMDVMIEVFKSIGELKGELQWIVSEMQDARREAKEYGELLNFQDAAKN